MNWSPFAFIGLVLAMVLLPARKALGYVAGKPLELDVESIGGGHWLRADAAQAFNQMRAHATADGVPLIVNEAFRTMGRQMDLKAQLGALAATPGYSNHQGGIAVDIDLVDEATGKKRPAEGWLHQHAQAYGWKPVGLNFKTPEPWHWEYRP